MNLANMIEEPGLKVRQNISAHFPSFMSQTITDTLSL